MSKIMAIARRIINQVRMDPRTIALILAAPILMITLLWLVLGAGVSKPILAVSGASDEFLAELQKNATVRLVDDAAAGRALVEARSVDGSIDASATPPAILVDGADPAITGLVAQAMEKSMMASLASVPMLAELTGGFKPDVQLLHGSLDATMFDYTAPVLMGFVIFFFIFILSGISFLRERLDGTLDRILAGPTSRMQVVAGYMLGYGSFAIVQTILIQSFMIFVLHTPSAGNFFEILLINLLLGLTGLAMGSLISAFAANEFQVFQFIPLVIVPQVLFAGIFNLREAPQWLQALAWIFPLSYGGDALRAVMVRGSGLLAAWPQAAALAVFIVLFMALSSLALRKRGS